MWTGLIMLLRTHWTYTPMIGIIVYLTNTEMFEDLKSKLSSPELFLGKNLIHN